MGLMKIYGALLQIPGMETMELTWQEQVPDELGQHGLHAVAVGGLSCSWASWSSSGSFSASCRRPVLPERLLRNVDELLAAQRIDEALEVTRESDSPGAKILYAGLERHEEGTERVMKAIENQGLIELSKLEKGLVILATLTNIGPLLGFLGTVIGMILAFQSIEAAGEVEATLVAGGIKVALLTTAFGLGYRHPHEHLP